MRRRVVLMGVMGAAALGVPAAAVVRASDTPPESDLSLATVEQRNLVRAEELDGVVGHGEKRPLRLTGNGIVTRLPGIGEEIQFGHPVAEVDGEPVVLLQGDRPAWRQLGPGMGKGEDVRQLEAALVAMGYADPEKVTVDDTWTAQTTAAVKALQGMLGMPVDGRLDPGEVVFSPDVVRVASIDGSLGDPASGAGIEVTGLKQSVSMSVAASKAKLLAVDDSVTIELPSGDTVDGVVDNIGDAVVGGDGSVTFPIDVTTDPLDLSDGVPVTVTVAVVAVENAIAVPVEALLALAEGGYAVEVPDSSQPAGTRLVGVEVGEFADGWVQITGDVAAGDQVVVP